MVEKTFNTLNRQRNFYNMSGSILIGDENFDIGEFINVSHSKNHNNFSLILYVLKEGRIERDSPKSRRLTLNEYIDNNVFVRAFYSSSYDLIFQTHSNYLSITYSPNLQYFLRPFGNNSNLEFKNIVFSPKFYLLASLFESDNVLDTLYSIFKNTIDVCQQ